MDKPQTWREKLYIIIFQTDTVAGRRFDSVLLLIILASLITVVLDSIEGIHRNYAGLLAGIEWGFTAIFAIEYLLRLNCSPKPLCYAFSFFGVVGLWAIVPDIIALYYTGPSTCRLCGCCGSSRCSNSARISSRLISCCRPRAAVGRRSRTTPNQGHQRFQY